MKNIKKRLLSLVLAVVMVLSMSMSVFAADATATPITVTVQFFAVGSTPENHYTEDGYADAIEVQATSGDSIESIVKKAIADKGLTASWNTVKDYMIENKTHQALTSITANGVTYATWIASDYSEGAGWTWTAELSDGTAIDNENYMCCRYMGGNGTIYLQYGYDDYTNY